MTNMVNSFTHETGTWHYAYSDKGLVRVSNKAIAGKKQTEEKYKRALLDMLEGRTQKFSAPLDITGTPFQLAVWEAISAVPHGKTISYVQLAKAAGNAKAIRAAGTACGANPVAVAIPCHRILRSNGELGGFGLGLPLKKRLLAYESGVAQIERQRVKAA